MSSERVEDRSGLGERAREPRRSEPHSQVEPFVQAPGEAVTLLDPEDARPSFPNAPHAETALVPAFEECPVQREGDSFGAAAPVGCVHLQNPQRRLMTTEEVAHAVFALIPHEARGIHGQAIPVDGGQVLE